MKKGGKSERRRREVKQDALDQMRATTNISELAKELGIPRRTLYSWRDAEQARADLRGRKPHSREEELGQEVSRLKEMLAERTLDLDFFRGALQRIRERRQPSAAAGGTASTSKSGK